MASAFLHPSAFRQGAQSHKISRNKRSFSTLPRVHDVLPSASASASASTHSKKTLLKSHQEAETIYALSSGGGAAATAVAVIRITGPQSHLALQSILSKTQEESYDHIQLPPPRYAALRMLHDPISSSTKHSGLEVTVAAGTKRDPLDSSLVLLFDGPKSFTGEDIVEIHSHGSRAVVQGVLSALDRLSSPPFNMNIRAAERGEFTKRAYGTGKLGLVEVEALADLIVADTSYQRLQALRQLDGRLSDLYEGWRGELIKGLAHAEAVIDFGDDEDLDDDDLGVEDDLNSGQMGVWGNIRPKMQGLHDKMKKHLQDAQRGEILRDGVKVAIVGVPNAGKSSLLNLLADRDAAIVSPIAGTTRDIVEVTLDLGGVRCIISDTAGVREDGSTDDIIEVEGIKRARKAAADSHVLVCMVDSTDEENEMIAINEILEDIDVYENDRNVVLVRNKMDLLEPGADANANANAKENVEDEKTHLSPVAIQEQFEISCETNSGVDNFISALTGKVLERVSLDKADDSGGPTADEGAVITRARHRRHVELAANALDRFVMRSGQGYMALDMAAEELRLAASELGRITGAVDVEDVLDVLFSDFCIGK